MAKIDINGLGIGYEIIGSGDKPAIITPGGRFTKETPGVRDLAENLAKSGYKVVIWDRPNSGESDVCFEGESESILNADTLAGLLRKLDMAPALVIGGSAGSRVSLIAARRHPDVVRKLVVLWITGGYSGLANLCSVYCGNAITAAKIGGMEAVCEQPDFKLGIERNPANRDRILAQDVEEWCAKMDRWAKYYLPENGSPVPGLLQYDFLAMKQQTLVFRSGISDPHHPRATTDEVHALIRHSTYVDPPWGDREWIDRMLDSKNGLFRNWGLLAPQIIDWDNSTGA